MANKRNKIIVLLLFFFLISVNLFALEFSDQIIPNEKQSLGVKAGAIIIVGDGELAANASSGYGNRTHPYLIENYNIIFSGVDSNGIEIYNTSLHFIILNCTIYNSYYSAIWLDNVSNANIINNTINNNAVGMVIQFSENITIYNNSISNNFYYGMTINRGINHSVLNNSINNNNLWGVEFEYKTNYSIISNNTINNNRVGIRLKDAHHNNITCNILHYNNLYISETEGSSYNIIENNDVLNTPDDPPPNPLDILLVFVILLISLPISFGGLIWYMKRFDRKKKLQKFDELIAH